MQCYEKWLFLTSCPLNLFRVVVYLISSFTGILVDFRHQIAVLMKRINIHIIKSPYLLENNLSYRKMNRSVHIRILTP